MTPDIFSKEKITLHDAAALFNYSIPTIIAVTLSSFNLWGNRLIVGYFGTERDTGIYQSISVITMLTTIVLSGVKITIAPTITKLFEDQNLEELRTTSQSAVRWLLYLATPIIIVPVVAPREILELLYGWGYSSGALPLIWLSIGQFFYITFGICDQLFIMTGRNKDWLVISAGIFILTITLDAIAIPIAGLLGAAIVSCAMMLLAGIIALVRLKQKLQFWLINQTHTRIGLAGIVACTITAILTNLAHVEALWKITSAGIVSITLFVAILLLFGIAPEDKKIFATVYKHIRR